MGKFKIKLFPTGPWGKEHVKIIRAKNLDAAVAVASTVEGAKSVEPAGYRKPRPKIKVIPTAQYFGQMTQMTRAYKGKFVLCSGAGELLGSAECKKQAKSKKNLLVRAIMGK